MEKAAINKKIEFSNVDGPGNRMSIFFQGCNYKCLYCHNPETIKHCNNCGVCIGVCKEKSLAWVDGKVIWDKIKCIGCDQCIKNCLRKSSPKTTTYTVKELIKEVKKLEGFISGVTVSGGEATLNYDFIKEFFIEVKKLELTTFVDTNGSLDLSDERYKGFVEVTDKFMLDVKVWNNDRHKLLTGKSNKNVKRNLEFLGELGKLYEVRTVVVPKIIDNEETVRNVSRILGRLNRNQVGEPIIYKLIKYRKIGVNKNILEDELLGVDTPSDDEMMKLLEIAKSKGVENIVIT